MEVPKQQCYRKPRKVCQTLVSTKPKIVTAQVSPVVLEDSVSLMLCRCRESTAAGGRGWSRRASSAG